MTTCKKMHIQMPKNAYDHAKKCTCTCKIMHMHMQKNAYAHANECTYICIFSCILKFYLNNNKNIVIIMCDRIIIILISF